MSKFIAVLIMLLIATCSLVLVGCGDDINKNIISSLIIRSADPLEKSKSWSEGTDALVTPELRDGKVSHMAPNLIIYYSSIENGANIVLMLSLLESQKLLSENERYNDFEIRLYNATGYDIKTNNLASDKYGGFFPQLVAGSFQFWLDKKNGLSFAESYQNNFASQMDLQKFMAVYLDVAQIMNQIAKTDYPAPDPATQEIFGQFKEITADQIQTFLEQCPNTALKRKSLFMEAPITNSIQYQ
jgi:hypothetical protein